MLAVGRPFRSRVSVLDRSIAAPVATPAPDRQGERFVARRQTFACRDCTCLRFCRSKPLHESLCAPPWYQPRRLAATAGNRSEVIKGNGLPRSRSSWSIRFEPTKNVYFVQERAGHAPYLLRSSWCIAGRDVAAQRLSCSRQGRRAATQCSLLIRRIGGSDGSGYRSE